MGDLPTWALGVEALSWGAAAAAGVVGVWKFAQDNATAQRQRDEELHERQEANLAADRDLQWRRAAAAQALLVAMEDDELAAAAMLMLDWDGRTYTDGEQAWTFWRADVVRALRTRDSRFTRAEVYVRDAFDHLFWYFERIQHQIAIGLITLEHVRFPLAYLTALLNENRDAFRAYLDAYDYTGSLQLMDAFEARGLPQITRHYAERSAEVDTTDAATV
jgi:hypothetical protein